MNTLSSLNISSSIAEFKASLTVISVGLLCEDAFLIDPMEEVALRIEASLPNLTREDEDLGRDRREVDVGLIEVEAAVEVDKERED